MAQYAWFHNGTTDTYVMTTWVPYDGYYPLREEGWLMEDPKPEPDDDAAEPENDEVPEKSVTRDTHVRETVTTSENDDDTEEPKP